MSRATSMLYGPASERVPEEKSTFVVLNVNETRNSNSTRILIRINRYLENVSSPRMIWKSLASVADKRQNLNPRSWRSVIDSFDTLTVASIIEQHRDLLDTSSTHRGNLIRITYNTYDIVYTVRSVERTRMEKKDCTTYGERTIQINRFSEFGCFVHDDRRIHFLDLLVRA